MKRILLLQHGGDYIANLVSQYKAVCIEEKIEFILKENEDLPSNHIGQVGLLLIYVSEKKYPGELFLVFHSKERTLHTSPGEMSVDVDNMTISLKTRNKNFYKFKVTNQVTLSDS